MQPEIKQRGEERKLMRKKKWGLFLSRKGFLKMILDIGFWILAGRTALRNYVLH